MVIVPEALKVRETVTTAPVAAFTVAPVSVSFGKEAVLEENSPVTSSSPRPQLDPVKIVPLFTKFLTVKCMLFSNLPPAPMEIVQSSPVESLFLVQSRPLAT